MRLLLSGPTKFIVWCSCSFRDWAMWCDGLDLKQRPQGSSRAEGQNVMKGLCKTPLLQECAPVSECTCVQKCLCVPEERYILITCTAWLLLARVTSSWTWLHVVYLIIFRDVLGTYEHYWLNMAEWFDWIIATKSTNPPMWLNWTLHTFINQ